MEDKRSKNVVIIALCLALIFMGVGFAALSQNLTISATGTIASTGSNAWNVHFDTFTDSTGKIEGNTGADTTVEQKYLDEGKLNATVTFELKKPGDMVQYTGVIKNYGTINAKLATYLSTFETAADKTDDQHKFIEKTITIDGTAITLNGDTTGVTAPVVNLAQNDTSTVVVTYKFKDVENMPTETVTLSDTMTFGFVQS